MSILSGFIKEKKYKKLSEGYKLVSQHTQSDTVVMRSGETLETALNGKSLRFLSQAEYNALSEAQKNDAGKVYFYY